MLEIQTGKVNASTYLYMQLVSKITPDIFDLNDKVVIPRCVVQCWQIFASFPVFCY